MVQDVGERACSACGAQNKAAAPFCWRCFASLSPGERPESAPPAPPLPSFRMPAPQMEPTEAPKRSGVPLAVWLTAGAVVAAAIAWFAIARLGGGPKLPDSVGGYSRIEVPELKQAIEAAKSQSGAPSDLDMDVGVYGGTQASPRLVLMWATSKQIKDPEAAFVRLASGLGVSAKAMGFETFTRDNRSYLCASSSDLGVTVPQAMDMCMWPNGGAIWILVDYGPGPTLDTTLDLADQVARQNA